MSTKKVEPLPRTEGFKEHERWRLQIRDATKATADHIDNTLIHQSLEQIMDMIASFLIEGANITLSYNDAADTLTITCDLSEHLAAADPHNQYQLESEKGVASGYSSLESDTKVKVAELRNPIWIGVSAPDPDEYPLWLDIS